MGWIMRTDIEVLDDIIARQDHIQYSLADADIDVYLFLLDRLHTAHGKISTDHVFQFLFRSYYRLDNAGLSPEFKVAYFKIMEENFSAKNIDLRGICKDLYAYKNRRHQNTLQFSFVSKLAAMIDPELPIYDLYVSKIFGFHAPYGHSTDRRLDMLLGFYQRLSASMRVFSGRQEYLDLQKKLGSAISHWTRLSATKQGDFILWAAGKTRD